MEDITDLLKAVKLWGWYDTMVDAKARKWEKVDAGLGEILRYEFEHEKDGVWTMEKTEDAPRKVKGA